MKLRDILFLIGTFSTSFGALILTQDVPKWFWWCGQAMVVLGPILVGGRVLGQKHKEEKQP